MSQGDDRDLRRAFVALRDADHRATPGFVGCLSAAQRRARRATPGEAPRSGAKPGLAWAAAALILTAVAVGVALQVGGDHGAAPLAREIAIARVLSSWEAPTDALLESPAFQILDALPTLEMNSIELPELNAQPDDGTNGT